jgi:orotate phosphoribosyltransferase
MNVEGDVEALSSILHSCGALVFGDFQISSGHRSPYYLDLGVLYSHPREYLGTVDILARLVNSDVSDEYVVAGVPLRGLPYAVSVAVSLGKPFVVLRREAKGYGMERPIEGRWMEGSRSIIIDDVASTGGNILKAVDELSRNGLRTSHAFVVVDRLQGAREVIGKKGVTLTSAADILQVMDSLIANGKVSDDEFSEVCDYTRRWSKRTIGP